jgi:HSP20 family protein
MTHLIRRDPFAEFASFSRALDRTFGFPLTRTNGEGKLTFPVDVSETEDKVTVKAVLPGVASEDVEVSVDEGVLTIKGEKKVEETEEKENYYRKEIRYGAFARSIGLPAEVKSEEAAAEFADGVLTITLPKAEAAKPKTIKINPASRN